MENEEKFNKNNKIYKFKEIYANLVNTLEYDEDEEKTYYIADCIDKLSVYEIRENSMKRTRGGSFNFSLIVSKELENLGIENYLLEDKRNNKPYWVNLYKNDDIWYVADLTKDLLDKYYDKNNNKNIEEKNMCADIWAMDFMLARGRCKKLEEIKDDGKNVDKYVNIINKLSKLDNDLRLTSKPVIVLKSAIVEICSLNISSEEINTKTTINEKLEKLKNHKIIDEYESKLKEVRKDLRTLIFEYNVVSEASDNLYNPKEAEDLLERLNYIIKKVEELKSKINIPDIDKYDDNYLYTLVEQYIEDFKNNRFVSEIKDSALYIMISEKLSELDVKKDSLQNKIEQRKEKLEIDESRIEQIKEKYYNFEKFNSELKKFNDNQEYVLKDIREKMANAVTIEERVETQIVGMQRQGRRLLQLMAASLMLPGARSARGLATMTASYLYFMRNIMRPNVTTRTLRTPVVTDYHKEIEKSISQLEDISETLHKTSRQIDLTIKEVKVQFEEYMNVIPECKALLLDLEKIKAEIEEKEYELKRIKEEQEKNLEKNDAKVKRMTN